MRILITHGYSDSNKGDLAITLATYKYLQDFYPDATLISHLIFRKNHKDFAYHNRFKVKEDVEIRPAILPTPYPSGTSSKFKDIKEGLLFLRDVIQLKLSLFSPILGKLFGGQQNAAVQDFKDVDLIIIKGGQFIQNNRETLRDNLFLWRIVQPLKVARQLNKRIIVFGDSFGSFATEKSEKTAIKYLDFCDEIYVREKVSYKFLEKYGIANKAKLIPDLAFYLKKHFNNENNRFKQQLNNCFGITVVNWNFAESKNREEAKRSYIENLEKSIENTYNKHKLIPVFIPQVTVQHHGNSDVDIIKIIHESLLKKGIPSQFLQEDFSVDEMMQIYSRCKFLIGTRLHSCILAANVETPIVAIRYQGFKTQGVMEELNLQHLVLDIHTLKQEELDEKIDIVLNDYDNIKKTIKDRTDSFIEDFEGLEL